MGFKIKRLFAFVSIDPDGDEGLIGIPLPGSKTLTMPAIAADERRLEVIYPEVKRLCDKLGVKFRVIQLGTRTDVTEEIHNLYK